jgi:hypothetical protein
MAQVLVGLDQTGAIRDFDEDGNLAAGGTKLKECIFINFARLLAKDEIKKGSFSITLGTGSYSSPFYDATDGYKTMITISDSGKENDYRVNSPAGEYAILSCSSGSNPEFTQNPACGLIFYQAGIVVLSSSIFTSGSQDAGIHTANEGILGSPSTQFGRFDGSSGNLISGSISAVLTGSAISASCNYLRNRIYDISFNNTTELNSTMHFCRVNHNDFNYSANPTYLSSSKIVVKNNTLDAPISYFTTVGLYSADNELLAVAKVSEPLKKDPTNEMTLRVRLDY